MNSVIKSILDRQKNPSSEKKIALVLYRGVMSGVVGTGATTALQELGLTDCFDYIFSYSAGFPNASYFLGGQAHMSSTVYTQDLSGSKFINFFKPWKIADIDYLIHVLRDIKTLDVDRIFKRKGKILLQIRNTSSGNTELLEIDKSFKDNYFDLIEASVKMPVLSPGSVLVHGNAYKDSPKLKDGFLNSINDYKDITDVLIIYCRQNNKSSVNLPGKNVFEIIPRIDTNGLETKKKILEKGFFDMKDLVKNYFLHDGKGATIIGHRGGLAGNGENTLEVFREGFLHGAEVVECDVQMTRDGVVLIHHNPFIKARGGKKSIDSISYEEARSLKPDICTLEHVLETLGDKRFIFELKSNSDYKKIIDIFSSKHKKYFAKNRFISFSIDALRYIKSKNKDVFCSYIGTSVSDDNRIEPFVSQKHIDLCAANGIDELSGHRLTFRPDMIEKAHEKGLQVGIGPVNSKATYNYCVQNRVDSIYTNNVIAIRKLAETGK